MSTPYFDIDTISYGLWRDTLMDMQPDRSMKSGFGDLWVVFVHDEPCSKLSSFMISVPDGSEIDYAEEPVYDISSLFADVGGAGLVLNLRKNWNFRTKSVTPKKLVLH